MQKQTFAVADLCRIAQVQKPTDSHLQRQTFKEVHRCRSPQVHWYRGTHLQRYICRVREANRNYTRRVSYFSPYANVGLFSVIFAVSIGKVPRDLVHITMFCITMSKRENIFFKGPRPQNPIKLIRRPLPWVSEVWRQPIPVLVKKIIHMSSYVTHI